MRSKASKAYTRRAFLSASGALAFLMATRAHAREGPVNIPGLSVRNSAAKNRSALLGLVGSSGSFYVPRGNYLVENSTRGYPHGMVIRNFSGSIDCAPDARFIMTDPRKGGMWFSGGSNTRVRGLRVTYQRMPRVRVDPSVAIGFEDISAPYVENAEAVGSPAIGVYVGNGTGAVVLNTTARDTMADGLNLSNCQDALVDGLITSNTGDDGLGLCNYLLAPKTGGIVARNINVKNSKARGIAVVGPSDVTVDGFSVDGTAVEGVISQLSDPSMFHVSDNVSFKNGRILNVGTLSGGDGFPYGIDFTQVGNMEVENVDVISPAGRGVNTWQSKTASLRLLGVRVKDAGENGFQIGNALNADVQELSVDGCNAYGYLFYDVASLYYRNLVAHNASKTNANHRALYILKTADAQVNPDMVVDGDEFTISSDQPTPTGWRINSAASGGTLGGSAGLFRVHSSATLPDSPTTGGFEHLSYTIEEA